MSQNIKILPASAQEVDAALLIKFHPPLPGRDHKIMMCIESPERQLYETPQVFVRLGTKVTDKDASNVGFRIFTRKASSDEPASSGNLEEKYYNISLRFTPMAGTIVHRRATEDDLADLGQHSIPANVYDAAVGMTGIDYAKQKLYCLEYHLNLQTRVERYSVESVAASPPTTYIGQVLALMQNFHYVRQCRLFFSSDPLLIRHLQQAINNECRGRMAPSWNLSLPETALKVWKSNIQDQMVHGSTDLLNVVTNANKAPFVEDGPSTDLKFRLDAIRFKNYVREVFPSIRDEPADMVYPIFLHVAGSCVNLPFGASMLNRGNTEPTLVVVFKLINTRIPGSRIGIVAFYPAQAEVYQALLQIFHRQFPTMGFDAVRADTLDNWAGQTIGIAVVDLVRTANASGNLGHLSQKRRLEVALTLHRDGLVVVGDRKCTLAADGSVHSVKLEKVLKWFDEHKRVVNVSQTGSPMQPNHGPSFDQPTLSTHRVHAGIVELDKRVTEIPTRVPNAPQAATTAGKRLDRQANEVAESFVRQQAALAASQASIPPPSMKTLQTSTKIAAPATKQITVTATPPQNIQATLTSPKSAYQISTDLALIAGPSSSTTSGSPGHYVKALRAFSPTFEKLKAKPLSSKTTNAPPTGPGNTKSEAPDRSPFNAPMTQASPQPAEPENPTSLGQQAVQPVVNFRDRYRAKYKAIQAVFDADHETKVSPRENQLFRRLADFYILEDATAFDRIYAELLALAAGRLI